jgi:hypothetical protein
MRDKSAKPARGSQIENRIAMWALAPSEATRSTMPRLPPAMRQPSGTPIAPLPLGKRCRTRAAFAVTAAPPPEWFVAANYRREAPARCGLSKTDSTTAAPSRERATTVNPTIRVEATRPVKRDE